MRPALLLFGFSLALRILFWLATPDRGAAWNLAFQGDAPVWQELAHKAATGEADELFRLPLRPPGMQWLVAALWHGSGPAWLPRLVFVLLGAAIAPLVWQLLRGHLTERAAFGAAVICAAATNLILLSSGLHVELPYLVLVLVSLFDQERLRRAASPWVAARWGALHAVLCLLRAEHAVTFVLLLGLLLLQHAARWRTTATFATLSFVLVLTPWHLVAWQQVDAYNQSGAPTLPEPDRAAPGLLPWDAAALARLRTLPAFQQGPAFYFVTDTVRHRGGTHVGEQHLEILREAYGVWPEPVPRPFLCLYGGLNFFLGNTPEAAGGFSQAALDRQPPFAGGRQRFPGVWLQNLPRDGQFALSYPPHLDLLVHGYQHGLRELANDPTGSLRRAGTKLWYGLEGATGGLGGYALPIGLSGVRRPVDLVTASGAWAAIWRTAVALIAAAGLGTLLRHAWAQAWLVFAATKLIVVVGFFGYARQGALCVPITALGLAAAADRWLLPRLPRLSNRHLGVLLLIGLVLLELVRCLSITATVDDLGAGTGALGPIDHAAHVVRYH